MPKKNKIIPDKTPIAPVILITRPMRISLSAIRWSPRVASEVLLSHAPSRSLMCGWPPARDNGSQRTGRLQSCIRPWMQPNPTAGPDEVREPRPHLSSMSQRDARLLSVASDPPTVPSRVIALSQAPEFGWQPRRPWPCARNSSPGASPQSTEDCQQLRPLKLLTQNPSPRLHRPCAPGKHASPSLTDRRNLVHG